MKPVRWIRSLFAAVLLGVLAVPSMTAQSLAVDLTGMNLTASGTYTTLDHRSIRDTVTWTVQVYYGTKGNRFVMFQGFRGSSVIRIAENRILIPAGENRGSKRRKDNNFTSIITLDQSANALKVTWESRGRDTRFANSKYIFWITLGNGTCRVDDFRYNADARLGYNSVVETTGGCTLTRGVPSDIKNAD